MFVISRGTRRLNDTHTDQASVNELNWHRFPSQLATALRIGPDVGDDDKLQACSPRCYHGYSRRAGPGLLLPDLHSKRQQWGQLQLFLLLMKNGATVQILV